MSQSMIESKNGAVPANGLALMLKQGTQDLHDQAESGDFQQRMVDGKLLREEFVAFLQQVWHVHRALDPLFRETASRAPQFAEMLHEDHFRLAKIEQDLADLGAEPTNSILPSTKQFVTYVSELAQKDPIAVIGVLYVKEGATNGNKIVAKRIREGLELGDGVAMGYLDPHGAEQRKRWMAFKEGLNNLELTAHEKERCVDAARAVFRLFIELSGELAKGTVQQPAPSA